jgi:hypothetical protein
MQFNEKMKFIIYFNVNKVFKKYYDNILEKIKNIFNFIIYIILLLHKI